ncbi:MAG: polymer-forming cytoskeletal protein [Myxococcota bacterium]|nr:polymer-forming cytoskeletal protein [Myxococcota bacterium]
MSSQNQPIELYIPINTKQEGQLSVQGRIRIDGHFIGNLYTESSLEIGPHGCLEGDADVVFADINGRLKGKLLVHEFCTLRHRSSFEGLLDTPLAQMEKGCRFKGEVRIRGSVSDE